MMFPFYPFPTSQLTSLTSLTSCLNISTEFNWGVPWSHVWHGAMSPEGDPVGLADWQVATEWWLCWNATALPDLRDLTAWESMGKHGKAMLAGLKLKHLKYPEMLILYFINLHHISSLSISATVLVSCASCRDILIASWRTCRFVAPARQCRLSRRTGQWSKPHLLMAKPWRLGPAKDHLLGKVLAVSQSCAPWLNDGLWLSEVFLLNPLYRKVWLP